MAPMALLLRAVRTRAFARLPIAVRDTGEANVDGIAVGLAYRVRTPIAGHGRDPFLLPNRSGWPVVVMHVCPAQRLEEHV